MSASRYMDKQIMDLTAASSSPNSTAGKDFLDLMNHPQDEDNHANQSRITSITAAENGTKKDEMFPSYDFQPIRPLTAHLDGGTANSRVWNSVDAKSKSYGSINSIEPEKTIIEKDRDGVDVAIVSEIDRTMKKHADNLMHALEGVSARLTQMETRTRQLESSVDDLKASVGNNYGSSDGKMRHLENIMREVQTGIQVLKDKQDLLEAHLQLGKLQVSSKPDQSSETQNATHMDSLNQAASAPVQSHQPLPPAGSFPQPQPQVSGPPALSQQNLSPPVQHPNQFPQGQVPSVPQPDPYYPPPTQTQEAPNQQYQMPPTQQLQPPPAAPPHQPYPPASQPQYSQPPGQPQPPQHQPPSGHRPEEPPHISSQGYAPNLRQPPSQPPQAPLAQHQPPLGHHPEEPPYVPSQVYPPNLRQPPSQPPSVSAPPQQYYGAPPHVYDPPQSRPSFPPSVPTEPYSSYGGPPSQYGSSAPMKNQQHLSLPTPQNAGTGYPQLPTARLLPQGLPTASGVGSSSGSPGSGNRVPLDDVVDKVTSMGFSRDLVRETVRKLTENGQSVDLNVVLDKLMNDGEVQQPPRGWFNR